MRFLNKLGLFLALSLGLACAQSTTVTGQLTDPDGITWNGATVTATFNPAPNYTGSYTWTGGPIIKVVNGVANGTGAFSISVMDNKTVIPSGTKWSFSFCPQVSTVCINTTPIVITGATQNINSLIAATIPPLRVNPNSATQAYNDMQVSVVPGTGIGQVYYNTNTHAMRQWNGTVWGPFVGNVFLPATTTLIAGDGTGNGAVGTSAIVATLLSGATNCSDTTKAYNPATNTCIASSANPGGTTTQVQFNDASAFGGSKVTYTKGGAADGTLTLFNGRLANRSDVIDLVADWGVVIDYNSGVGTDNCTALTNALASNPKGRFFLPPSNGGFAFSSCDITLQKSGQLFSTSFGYNQDNGAHNFPFNPNTGFGIPGSNLIFASGVNGIHRQEGSVVHDIGIVGLDPGPRFVTDTNLAIIPAGQFLSLYIDSTVVSVVRTSNVVTATFGPAFPPWFNPKGIIKVVGATPSDLNGTFYVVSSGMSGSQGVMTWNQTGVNESASVMPSIQPGTTGLNHSSGMMIEGTKTITYNTAISNFANNCFEVTPGPSGTFISDDTQFDNSWVAGCGNAGLAILGGNDTSKGVYNHLNLYFNQLYNLNASSFLGDKFNQPQSSYPSLYNGLNAGATVNITTATTVAGLITVQTAASHGLKIGNGAIILGTTQSAHNLPISGTISCWVLTVPDATHFTCQLPSNASSVTSTGGTVNLPGKNDFLTGFGADTGHYAVGRHGLSAHNSLDEPYAEGGGIGVNPDGCGARFNGSVIIKQPHTGDPFCGGSIVQSDGNFGLTFLADALTAATGGLNITARGTGFLPSIFKVDSTGLTNAIGGFLTAGGFGTNVASVAQFGFLSGNAAIVGYGPNGSTVGGALLGGITSTGGSFTQYLTCTLGTGCTLGVPITLSTATTGCVSGTVGVLSIASGIPCGTLRTAADVVGQWTSCTSGWLAFNFTCSSPTAATQRGADAVREIALDNTGATDNSSLLQTYISGLSTNGSEIYFPCGTYKFTTGVHITNQVSLTLTGGSTTTFSGNTNSCVNFNIAGGINGFWFDYSNAATSNRGIHVRHIQFTDTSASNIAISALRLASNNYFYLEDVGFQNFQGSSYAGAGGGGATPSVTVTNGSATVTGISTAFTSTMDQKGLIWIAGRPQQVDSINVGTQVLTLTEPYEGATNAVGAAYELDWGGLGFVCDGGVGNPGGSNFCQYGTVINLKSWKTRIPVMMIGGTSSATGTSRIKFYGGSIDCQRLPNSTAFFFGGFSDTNHWDVTENNCTIGGVVERGHEHVISGNFEIAGGVYPPNTTCAGSPSQACTLGLLIRGFTPSNTRQNTVSGAEIAGYGTGIEVGTFANGTIMVANNYTGNTTNRVYPAAGTTGFDTRLTVEQDEFHLPVGVFSNGSVRSVTTTSDTIATTDINALVRYANASTITVTIPVASTTGFGGGAMFHVKNTGAGSVVLTPTTSLIDGVATVSLAQNQGLDFYSDGTNYFTQQGRGAATNAANLWTFKQTYQGGNLFRQAPNAQVGTSYTILNTDEEKLLSFNNAGAIAVTLPQATTAGFTTGAVFHLVNIGAGTVTVTPTTSTVNGAASFTLTTGQGCDLYSDGTNYTKI